MRREAQAFLDRVRDAEDPTQADEARVQRALQAAIAAGIAPSTPAPAGPSGRWYGEPPASGWLVKLGAIGGKLNWVAVGLAAALGTGDLEQVHGQLHSQLHSQVNNAEREVPLVAPPAPQQPLPPRVSEQQPLPLPEPPREQRRPRERQLGLQRELELLRRVQAALKGGDGASALLALDSHVTADVSLLAERRAARILALCMLQRVGEARRAARQFRVQHPDSLQLELVASSCANR